MNVCIVYLDILRPFAESILEGNMNKGPAANPRWIYDTPIHSEVEAKLREFLVQLGHEDRILGIQRASGKKFQEILEEAFIRPLNIEGELYVGIPPGVESRLQLLQ
ncbi:uncharacterized protein LOC116139610 [Pistacia vera]|uniref:uncharacterized protein LOC116139610 n=1 Tax=Pistacia vera TaxID=55513 RepID=UPI001263324A|nr:uncharacterized protein LOC116139610 [Pistacia vera]